MTKIRNEKLRNYINREASKILALSLGKIDKYEYLTREEILPPRQKKSDTTSLFYILHILPSVKHLENK